MKPEIAAADINEAKEILKLQRLCYQSEAAIYDDYSIPPLVQTLESMLADFDTQRILAAKIGSEIVGSVRACASEAGCRIGRLIVHPRLRRQGLGSELMRRIEEDFPDVRRYELFTGHRSEGNLRLYDRIGYREFKRERVSPVLVLVYLEKYRL